MDSLGSQRYGSCYHGQPQSPTQGLWLMLKEEAFTLITPAVS